MKKILAFILSAVMIFTLTVTPASAIDIAEVKTVVTDVLCKALAFVFEGLVNGIVAPIREGDNFISEEEYLSDSLCGGLYDGTDLFLSEAPADARWSLGSASASLVPEDWETYSDLYLGGYMSTDNYMSNDVREILDDMRVRVIAMSDGTGRGTAVFATIDSIGLGNSDVEGIRRMLDGFAQAKGINSINIFTTHSHSGIDTQGLWTDILGTWPFAFIKGYTGMGDYYGGDIICDLPAGRYTLVFLSGNRYNIDYNFYFEINPKVTSNVAPTVTVTTSAASGKPVISWKAVEGATGYEVYHSTGGSYSKLITTTGLSVTNTSAAVGSNYFYKVRALYGDKQGEFSEVKSAWCTLKQPVITVASRASDGKPVISWKAVEGAIRYDVYRSTGSSSSYSKLISTTRLSVTNTSAKAGNTYSYKVIAVSAVTSKANSADSTVKTIAVP